MAGTRIVADDDRRLTKHFNQLRQRSLSGQIGNRVFCQALDLLDHGALGSAASGDDGQPVFGREAVRDRGESIRGPALADLGRTGDDYRVSVCDDFVLCQQFLCRGSRSRLVRQHKLHVHIPPSHCFDQFAIGVDDVNPFPLRHDSRRVEQMCELLAPDRAKPLFATGQPGQRSCAKETLEIKHRVDDLHEANPMMGHRGCRLAVTYPEIAAMQTRAVIEAAINVSKKHPDWNIVPEIMIPLVGELKELQYVKSVVTSTADKIIEETGAKLKYKVGTMIEIPRAALTADEIAKEAEFFSFGTNDLTQMTFGFSRDDAGKFLGAYYDKKIYEFDPFAKLDQDGVGKLVKMASDLGKKTRPDIKLGICGEHGGDPSTIEFCHKTGLTYVSCSPFRVPIARLAAAQAAIKYPR